MLSGAQVFITIWNYCKKYFCKTPTRQNCYKYLRNYSLIELPDLTKLYPEKYIRREGEHSIFEACSDDDFRFMESLITEHRYYESFGAWSPNIDLDKHVTGLNC